MTVPLAEHSRKREAQAQLWTQWKKEPSSANRKAVLDTVLPVVDTALKSHVGGDENYRTRALILASEAMHSYDPKRGASLSSHVFSHLQRLSRVRASREQTLKIPENVRFDWSAVRRAETELEAREGRPPTLTEVADETGLSVKRISKARRAMEAPHASIISEKGDDTILAEKKSTADVWRDYVYYDLDSVGKKVFEWTTGYGGSPILPKQDIARRLKITPAAVSGRITTITKRLAEVSA